MRKQPFSQWCVYGLVDPCQPERIRYVGVTRRDLRKRYSQHINDARHGERGAKANWIRGLLRAGATPVVTILERGIGDTGWQDAEVTWIRTLREKGDGLLNLTDGGEGAVGCVPSAETRAKLSAIHKGRKMSDAQKQLLSKLKKGRPCTPEERERLMRYVHNRSEEMRWRMGASHRGKKNSDETRRRKSVGHTGIRTTEQFQEAWRKAVERDPSFILRGEQCGKAIVTEAQVREIRERYAAGGISYRLLGMEYGITKPAIKSIVQRRNWRHVE